MTRRSIYKGLIKDQWEFDHRYACWANNHRGWAKMKKANRKLAKKRLKKRLRREDGEECTNITK